MSSLRFYVDVRVFRGCIDRIFVQNDIWRAKMQLIL
jgi:hypothetical protein